MWSAVPRLRGWWPPLRGLKGDHKEHNVHFNRYLVQSGQGAPKFKPREFPVYDKRGRQAVATSAGHKMYSELGPRKTTCKNEVLDYKVEHLTLFQKNIGDWPPRLGKDETPSHIDLGGLLGRAQQVVFVRDKVWEPDEDTPLQFVDVNPTVNCICDARPITLSRSLTTAYII